MKNIILFISLIFLIVSCQKDKDEKEKQYGTGLLTAPSNVLNNIPAAIPPTSGGSVPSSYDLSDNMPPVRSQGEQGSCSSWATGYYLKSYHENIENHVTFGTGTNYEGVYSPAYIFNIVKSSSDCTKGSYLYKNLDRLKDVGVAPWDEMPYDDTNCSEQPSEEANNKAKCAKIESYSLLYNQNSNSTQQEFLNKSKQFISQDIPIVIGIPLDENFIQTTPLTNGDYIYTNYDDTKNKGGHAVLVVGYDDDKNAFKVINSWGTNWGNNGYFWFDYDLYTNITNVAYVTTDVVVNCDSNNNNDTTGILEIKNNTAYQRYFQIKKQGVSSYNVDDQMVISANQTSSYFNLEVGVYIFEASNTDYYISDQYYSSGQINITGGTYTHQINN